MLFTAIYNNSGWSRCSGDSAIFEAHSIIIITHTASHHPTKPPLPPLFAQGRHEPCQWPTQPPVPINPPKLSTLIRLSGEHGSFLH